MSDTPVFERLFKESNPFKPFPTEYTDRFTPEVARQQGFTAGYQQALNDVTKLICKIKPTKTTVKLLDDIEEMANERV
jgi:hypothetical protein